MNDGTPGVRIHGRQKFIEFHVNAKRYKLAELLS